ncbi:MAG: hypothetical protein KBC96_13200 [Armatimonadetes bacterium]|nr:hypothetical protein [Armatimonadota bacterium]
MSENTGPETLKEKLLRALKHKAVLAERSKRLQQQVDDFRNRESTMNHVTSELLQRQRELNFMLHRASSVLHQMQETNLALSAEFTHIVKELPAPRDGEAGATSDWDETINRVNDLFRRTHELAGEMQDEIFRSASGSAPLESMSDQPETASNATPSDDTDPEPRVVETHAWTPERHVAETIGQVATLEVSDAREAEAESEPAIVRATIVDAPPTAETNDDDGSVEDLFRRLNAITDDPDEWQEDGSASLQSSRKPSLLARIFGMGEES